MSGYEWNAASYKTQSHAQASWAGETIARLALNPRDHVLDVGCGDGKVTARIAESVSDGRVVGIDSSKNMIDYAAREFAEFAPKLSFAAMDASGIEYENEFDAVFSNAVLHWIKDHGPVLRGIRRALRKGGRVSMQMGGRGNAAEVHSVMDEIRSLPEWSRYFEAFGFPYSFYGPEEYAGWLREAGLEPLRVELVSRPMRHTPDQFGGWLTTTWMPYTSRIPGVDRPRFIAQVVDRFVCLWPPDDEGILTVPMIRLNVDALKH